MTPQAYSQQLQAVLPISASECNHAVNRAVRFGVDPLDALQTLAEWQLSGRPVKWATVLTRISHQSAGSRCSLDAETTDGRCLGDTTSAPVRTRDETERLVLTVLHHSVQRGWITSAQAGVIWAHVCEGHSLAQIGRGVGYADHTTAAHHYHRAVKRLRERLEGDV
jgi:hypothetical protein